MPPYVCIASLTPYPQASTSASTFGQRIPYGKEAAAALPPGHQLQFGEALRTACEQIIIHWATPTWAYTLPIPFLHQFLSHIQLSYQELATHLHRLMAESRKTLGDAKADSTAGVETLQDDLLRRLVESNAVEVDVKKRLSDDELLSNMFVRIPVLSVFSMARVFTWSMVLQIFLVAGHGSQVAV